MRLAALSKLTQDVLDLVLEGATSARPCACRHHDPVGQPRLGLQVICGDHNLATPGVTLIFVSVGNDELASVLSGVIVGLFLKKQGEGAAWVEFPWRVIVENRVAFSSEDLRVDRSWVFREAEKLDTD